MGVNLANMQAVTLAGSISNPSKILILVHYSPT